MSVTEAAVAGAASGAPSRPVAFIGADKDYCRILVRGAFLLMVTLGLYRFWLATDIRRFRQDVFPEPITQCHFLHL